MNEHMILSGEYVMFTLGQDAIALASSVAIASDPAIPQEQRAVVCGWNIFFDNGKMEPIFVVNVKGDKEQVDKLISVVKRLGENHLGYIVDGVVTVNESELGVLVPSEQPVLRSQDTDLVTRDRIFAFKDFEYDLVPVAS